MTIRITSFGSLHELEFFCRPAVVTNKKSVDNLDLVGSILSLSNPEANDVTYEAVDDKSYLTYEEFKQQTEQGFPGLQVLLSPDGFVTIVSREGGGIVMPSTGVPEADDFRAIMGLPDSGDLTFDGMGYVGGSTTRKYLNTYPLAGRHVLVWDDGK